MPPRIADPLPLATPRTLLRRLAPADLADFQAYRHDPAVGLYQGWLPQPDPEALAFLSEMSRLPLFQPGQWSQIGIAEPGGKLIGDIGVGMAPDAQTATVGFTLRAASQGQGLAQEAVSAALGLIFQHTAVIGVNAFSDTRNLPSIRLLERLGMCRTATHDAIFRGEACQEYEYALARPANLRSG